MYFFTVAWSDCFAISLSNNCQTNYLRKFKTLTYFRPRSPFKDILKYSVNICLGTPRNLKITANALLMCSERDSLVLCPD